MTCTCIMNVLLMFITATLSCSSSSSDCSEEDREMCSTLRGSAIYSGSSNNSSSSINSGVG